VEVVSEDELRNAFPEAEVVCRRTDNCQDAYLQCTAAVEHEDDLCRFDWKNQEAACGDVVMDCHFRNGTCQVRPLLCVRTDNSHRVTREAAYQRQI